MSETQRTEWDFNWDEFAYYRDGTLLTPREVLARLNAAEAEREALRKIVDTFTKYDGEFRENNPCPDPILRQTYRERLRGLAADARKLLEEK